MLGCPTPSMRRSVSRWPAIYSFLFIIKVAKSKKATQPQNLTRQAKQSFSVNISHLLGRPFVKRFAGFSHCYRTVVFCRACLSVTLEYCGQTVGWIRVPLGMEVGLGPAGGIVLDGDPAPLKAQQPPTLRPMSVAAKRSPISATVELLLPTIH